MLPAVAKVIRGGDRHLSQWLWTTRFHVVVSSGVLRFFGGLTAAELDAAPFRLYSLIFVLSETLVQNEEFHSLLSSAVFTERLLYVTIDEAQYVHTW